MHGRLRDQPSLPWQGRGDIAAQSSYEGAKAAAVTSTALCAVLRRYLVERGTFGATDAEIERDLGWRPNVVTARRNDLVDAGEVVIRYPDSRRRSVREGGRRLDVVVWILSAVVRGEAA